MQKEVDHNKALLSLYMVSSSWYIFQPLIDSIHISILHAGLLTFLSRISWENFIVIKAFCLWAGLFEAGLS